MFSVSLIAYCIIGLLLLPYYRYQVEPDGISYLSIAYKWFNGDFANAVNGHWSPLFSWLILPFYAMGFDPTLSAKLLNFMLGLITIAGMKYFLTLYDMSDSIKSAIYAALVPVILYFAYYHLNADLLIVCVLVFYFTFIFKKEYGNKISDGILCGITGGIAYLAKSFGFTFFASHFLIMNIIYFIIEKKPVRRKNILICLATGYFMFLLISTPWIIALSNKYGYLLMSTQPKNNLQFIGTDPEFPDFVEPPNESANSIWEDPFYVLPLGTWSPFESLDALTIWIKFFLRKIPVAVQKVFNFSPLVAVIVGMYFFYLLLQPKKIFIQPPIIYYLLLAICMYAGGYCLVLVFERYLWIINLLLMCMGGLTLNRLFSSSYFSSSTRRLIILILFIFSFSLLPVQNLIKNINTGKEIYLLAEELKHRIPPSSRIATDEDWWNSIFLAFHLKSSILGATLNLNEAEAAQALTEYNIGYYIAWNETTTDKSFLKGFEKIKEGIYQNDFYAVYKKKSTDGT